MIATEYPPHGFGRAKAPVGRISMGVPERSRRIEHREPEPAEDFRLWRGLALAMPVSALLWGGLCGFVAWLV